MLKENQHFNTINNLYPHIGDKLEMFWGHLDFVRYVDKLIYDTRDGGRKGFPAPVFMALYQLSEDHFDTFPHLRTLAKKDF